VITLKKVTEKRKVATADPYKPLLAGIVALLEESRRAAGRGINSILTSAYWEIGRRIVVEEQRGRRKANYGEQMVEQLATDLTARFGKGFSRTNVFQMRQNWASAGSLCRSFPAPVTLPDSPQPDRHSIPIALGPAQFNEFYRQCPPQVFPTLRIFFGAGTADRMLFIPGN
jgi:hypothetical protein